jgi:hypothetical protein
MGAWLTAGATKALAPPTKAVAKRATILMDPIFMVNYLIGMETQTKDFANRRRMPALAIIYHPQMPHGDCFDWRILTNILFYCEVVYES